MTENTEANPVDIGSLANTITQREWLLICRSLEASKDEVLERSELLMPAIAWVHEKRAHGGADWDRILDLTDPELLELLGIKTDDEINADEVATPFVETVSSGTGASTEPASVSQPDSAPLTTTTSQTPTSLPL